MNIDALPRPGSPECMQGPPPWYKEWQSQPHKVRDIAATYLLYCLQSNGASLERKVEIYNQTTAFVGIQAWFVQYQTDDGKTVAGWMGEHEYWMQMAKDLRADLSKCWPRGSYESEEAAVCRTLLEYQDKAKAMKRKHAFDWLMFWKK